MGLKYKEGVRDGGRERGREGGRESIKPSFVSHHPGLSGADVDQDHSQFSRSPTQGSPGHQCHCSLTSFRFGAHSTSQPSAVPVSF